MLIAWLFPGQGSQSVGMGKDVLDASAAARDVLARADAALGESLTKIILEGPEETLTLTANAQPAIVAISCAILAAIRERVQELPLPAFAAGHSLGEYSALVAAGALTLEDAVRIVRARGRAMQDAVPPGAGAMAAIMGLDMARLEAICDDVTRAGQNGGKEEVVSCANFNAPGQIVIAGSAAAVARASERVAAEKGKAILLKVSAPFHCALMQPAADAMAEALAKIDVKTPAVPLIANVLGAPIFDPAEIKQRLVEQVTGTVRWRECVAAMAAAGVTHMYEIGSGKVLAGLAKRIVPSLQASSIGTPAEIEAALPALMA
jgi:[acyl-carrier-protein] S-malonyltransferase